MIKMLASRFDDIRIARPHGLRNLTCMGLIPLAIGLNINFFSLFASGDPQIYFGGENVIFWGPLAWTVIFGLTFATFLTLVIVPVTFFLSKRAAIRMKATLGS